MGSELTAEAGVTNSRRKSMVNFTGATTQKERRAGELLRERGVGGEAYMPSR